MNSELHLFIIWEKGRKHELEILSEISKKFFIQQTFSITWSPYYVGRNFTRFYGESLPKNSFKELHCGAGEFKLIVVLDKNPLYEIRKTSKGDRTVNTNMFDTKSKLRNITGGGHKIHGTDNEIETKHDLALLIGLSKKDFLNRYTNIEDDIQLKQDLVGTNGWKSFDELFYILNECSEYLVLRNPENINLTYFSQHTGDIDILAKDAMEIKYALGDLQGIEEKRSHLKVDVDKCIILFEVDQYDTNLFDIKFENKLFETKEMTSNIYHPNKELEMYVLIYHALLNKQSFENKHKVRILEKYSKFIDQDKDLEQQLLSMLINYFTKNNYHFTPPNKGFFNYRKEIKPLLISNKDRDSLVVKRIKQILSFETTKRSINIKMFVFTKKILVVDIQLPFSFRFKLNVGLR